MKRPAATGIATGQGISKPLPTAIPISLACPKQAGVP